MTLKKACKVIIVRKYYNRLLSQVFMSLSRFLESYKCSWRDNSPFTHPQVVPNLYEFLSSVEHKRRYFRERW